MQQSGITTEGHPVISGAFALVGTHGVQLETILSGFRQKQWVMNWPDYIRAALSDGHNLRTVRARILAAAGEIYGPAYTAELATRLDRYLGE